MRNQFLFRTAIMMLSGIAVVSVAQTDSELPDPLTISDVISTAIRSRAEVAAANARAEALAQRPAIVSALEDPMITASIDHYPYEVMDGGQRFDRSIAIEQRFPLSRLREHRRAAAQAEALRAKALADVTGLDVVLEAQRRFFMLLERRKILHVLAEQVVLAEQLVAVAASRYASGAGLQADVLRAEVEVARLRAEQLAQTARVRAAEAMLNGGLGRAAQAKIPTLSSGGHRGEPPSEADVLQSASVNRPELGAGAAEVSRAKAESAVMRSMYKPMAMIRIGQAETMAEGAGAMLMVGLSIPIWRARLHAGVAEAYAMQRMADSDLDAMRRMIESDSIAAREQVMAVRARAEALNSEVLPRARAATDVALASYSAGQGTLLAVIEAARALWDVQEEQIMAEAAVGEAWAGLDRAMGTRRDGVQ